MKTETPSRARTTAECCGGCKSEPLPQNHVAAILTGVQPSPSIKGVTDKFPGGPSTKELFYEG